MKDLNRLQLFTIAARFGSMSKAAAYLGIAKSSLSKQISALEGDLGLRLFDRSSRGLQLTDEGLVLFEQGELVVEQCEQFHDLALELEGTPAGRVRIGVSALLAQHCIIPKIRQLMERYPALELQFRIRHSTERPQPGDETDISIIVGELPNSSLICRRVATMHNMTVAAPQYLERYGTPSTPSELHQHNCLVTDYENIDYSAYWAYQKNDVMEPVSVSGNIRAGDSGMVKDMVVAGCGISSFPIFAIKKELESGELVQLFTDFDFPSVPMYMVYSSRKNLPPKLKVAVDFLAECLEPLTAMR